MIERFDLLDMPAEMYPTPAGEWVRYNYVRTLIAEVFAAQDAAEGRPFHGSPRWNEAYDELAKEFDIKRKTN